MIFDEYIRKSSCNLKDCPYGYGLSCVECHEKMIEEHDAKVREEAIDEFVEKADSAIYEDFNKTDVGEYTIADVALTIRRVAEQLKEIENE